MKDVSALVAPCSIELEQALLGAVLANNERFHKVGSLVEPHHFFDPVHAAIWKNMAARISRDHLATPATLKADFDGHDGLKTLGGVAYFARLLANSVAGSAVADYARELVELWRRREVLRLGDEIGQGFGSGGLDADGAVASMELFLADQDAVRSEPRSMSLLKAQTLALQEAISASQSDEFGIPTGLPPLDGLVALRRKRFTLLAGATSMGKTALALHLAYSAAQAGHGVGFVSLEMGEEDLANRINSIETGIPYKAYDRPMSETLLRKRIEAAKAQEALPIEIFSDRVRDVPAILSEAKRLKHFWGARGQFRGLSLLVIDYIQLVRGKGTNEFHVLSKVANDLKQVAKQLDVHVLALGQIDRKTGERDNPRPRLSDLRGSGDLEMAPDNVLFVYRPEYYLERQAQAEQDIEKRADLEATLSATRNMAEIICAKARMGELGSVMVNCDMSTNRFWAEAKSPELDF